MVPIITEMYRHAMYHFLHVPQHLVICCKQDQLIPGIIEMERIGCHVVAWCWQIVASYNEKEAMQIGLQNWLLAQTTVLLSRAFQGMAQYWWFQSVADCMLLACTGLEEVCMHLRRSAARAAVGLYGQEWAGMSHLRLVWDFAKML